MGRGTPYRIARAEVERYRFGDEHESATTGPELVRCVRCKVPLLPRECLEHECLRVSVGDVATRGLGAWK